MTNQQTEQQPDATKPAATAMTTITAEQKRQRKTTENRQPQPTALDNRAMTASNQPSNQQLMSSKTNNNQQRQP
jgi:hypothetical protein